MRIHRKKLWDAIQRYADAHREDAQKGGGDPGSIPEIEEELSAASVDLTLLVRLVVPVSGVNVERVN